MLKVYLSYAQTRFQYGERTYAVRSRFLDEIDPALVTMERSGNGRAGARHAALPPDRPVRTRTPQSETFDPPPNYEDESQVPLELAVGAKVLHQSFGRGRVIAVEGRGERARAVVEFDSVGRKHLMLKFAHLRPG